jgi:hypothetical protein
VPPRGGGVGQQLGQPGPLGLGSLALRPALGPFVVAVGQHPGQLGGVGSLDPLQLAGMGRCQPFQLGAVRGLCGIRCGPHRFRQLPQRRGISLRWQRQRRFLWRRLAVTPAQAAVPLDRLRRQLDHPAAGIVLAACVAQHIGQRALTFQASANGVVGHPQGIRRL